MDGPFQVVSDVHAKELEAFHPLHSLSMDGCVLPLLSPKVHNQLLRFVDFEGEVIFLAPHSQGPHLLHVGCCVVCKLDD